MIEKFGTLQDGRTVHRITINKGPLKARILTYGATLQDFRLNGHDNSLTLGFATLGDYVTHGGYFGATVGRCANRIGHAKFDLDGRSYELDANFLDKHQLHGGRDGTATRVWSIDKAEPDYVTLTHELPDGHMGYPGNLKISATFGVDKSLEVSI